jgi:hypothetical protein
MFDIQFVKLRLGFVQFNLEGLALPHHSLYGGPPFPGLSHFISFSRRTCGRPDYGSTCRPAIITRCASAAGIWARIKLLGAKNSKEGTKLAGFKYAKGGKGKLSANGPLSYGTFLPYKDWCDILQICRSGH